MDTTDLAEVRRTLWTAADEMRANSTLGPAEIFDAKVARVFDHGLKIPSLAASPEA